MKKQITDFFANLIAKELSKRGYKNPKTDAIELEDAHEVVDEINDALQCIGMSPETIYGDDNVEHGSVNDVLMNIAFEHFNIEDC